MAQTETMSLVTGVERAIRRATTESLADKESCAVVACLDIDDSLTNVSAGLAGGQGYVCNISIRNRVPEVDAILEEVPRFDQRRPKMN